MKKLILIFMILSLTGCNGYLNLLGDSKYTSDIAISMCKVENNECIENLPDKYNFFIRVAPNNYIVYLHDMGSYYYSAGYIDKEHLDLTISEIKRFIQWADLDDTTRAKTKFNLNEKISLQQYSYKNTPYLIMKNTSKGLGNETQLYALIDKNNAKIMLNELTNIQKTHFKI